MASYLLQIRNELVHNNSVMSCSSQLDVIALIMHVVDLKKFSNIHTTIISMPELVFSLGQSTLTILAAINSEIRKSRSRMQSSFVCRRDDMCPEQRIHRIHQVTDNQLHPIVCYLRFSSDIQKTQIEISPCSMTRHDMQEVT